MSARTLARRALISALVVLGLGAAGLMCQRVGARGRYVSAYSTYGAGPDGTRGLYLLTQEIGARPSRWAEDLGRLPEAGMLVALGSCDQLMRRPMGRIERENLRAWVERGGVLVVAGVHDYVTRDAFGVAIVRDADMCRPEKGLLGMLARAEERANEGEGADPEPTGEEDPSEPTDLEELPDAFREDPAGTYDEVTEEDPLPAARLAFATGASLAGMAPVSMRRALQLEVDPNAQSETLMQLDGTDGRPVAVRVSIGRGSVIALSSASALTNGDLREGNGGVLFARLVRAYAPSGPVLFDEFHLGVGERRSMMRYLRQVGLTAVIVQVVLLIAFLLWRAGARFGGVQGELPPQPGGTASYVDGVATLYAKARDPGGAGKIVARRALARVAAHHHLPTSDPTRMIEILTQRKRDSVAVAVAALARLAESDAGSRGLTQLTNDVDGLVAQALAESMS